MTFEILRKEKTKSNTKTSLYIVGIGSSAGGLQALELFLKQWPTSTSFSFVIIQHLSPNHKSLISEILARYTQMKVKEAIEGDVVLPNCIYIKPGAKNLEIKNGKLKLTDRPPNNQINFSIDIFLTSLAKEQKEKAIAIILSGTGTDGTKGAKAIKETGGIVFVQNPKSSSFNGMPNSVISQGLADFILPPNQIPTELINLVIHPNSLTSISSTYSENENNEILNKILKILKTHTGYNFFSYKKHTLFRRIEKRINITRSKNLEQYIVFLKKNTEEKFILAKEFLIGVTNFFRDNEAFKIIENQVIPSIVNKKTRGDIIKIWIVACSTGEEAYSITILLHQYLIEKKIDIDFKVFATDLDEAAISIASKGIYNKNIEAELPPEILNNFFIKESENYKIDSLIRQKVIFSKHDILQNPPFIKMDLISCRNMLIYMENNIQAKVMASLHYALNLNGFLFLGSSESIGVFNKNFEEINAKWRIYKNTDNNRKSEISKNNQWRIRRDGKISLKTNNKTEPIAENITKSINKVLMDQLCAVSICIDDNFEIIHATGKLKKYIQYPEEGYSNNLLKILPNQLNIPIGSAVRKLHTNTNTNKKNKLESIEKRIRFVKNNSTQNIRIITAPLNIFSNNKIYIVTLIEENTNKTKDDDFINIHSIVNNNKEIEELKEALGETRDNLQTTIEELENSNEEMQATNEELLASNEELQSTNEELQSLNEELHTVNAELQDKNTELIELNSDIENLMKNINIGTIFLDKDFLIRKFTPSITEHFQLMNTDIGRSISHFSGTLGGEDLIKYSKKVIDTLQPFKKEVKNAKRHWFLMQIFPYRSQEDIINGVVINFININESKKIINEKNKINNFLTHLLDSNPAIIYVYNLIENKNIYSNANIAEMAGYSTQEIKNMGNDLLKNVIHPNDLPKVYKHFERLRNSHNDDIIQIEYRLITKNNKKFIWVLTSDKVYERNKEGKAITSLGIAQEITHYKNLKLKLKQSEERFRLAIKSTGSALWEWSSLDTDEAWYSNELYSLLGYSKEELTTNFSNLTNLIHPEYIKIFRTSLSQHVEEGTPFEEEILIKTKNNGYRWFKVNGKTQPINQYKNDKKIVGTLLDINQKKESENKMCELNVELERFAYLASHDLKEPLNTVTSFTKLFKEDYGEQFDETANQYLNFIEQASTRMITLTNDLLLYSQLDKKSLNLHKFDLNEVLEKVKLDLQDTITKNNAKIVSLKKLPEIIGNEIQISQLLQNLISNSLKYRSENDPVIEISFSEKISYFEISVKDNGIGIDEKHHSKIFEVFKRLHCQSEYEGTGIGLANCKRIADNHGGRIWVKSKQGDGAEFIFTIPKLNENENEKN